MNHGKVFKIFFVLKIAGTDMFEYFMHEYYNIGSHQNKIKPYDQCCIQGKRRLRK